jgi:hypothetical protein
MASTRQCLLNQFADLSVCANQNNLHKNSILVSDLRIYLFPFNLGGESRRFDECAVLNIVRRPMSLSGRVISLVKQGVEGLEHQRFVFLLYRLTHNNFLLEL